MRSRQGFGPDIIAEALRIFLSRHKKEHFPRTILNSSAG